MESSGVIAIQAGLLIDGTGAPSQKNAVLLVAGKNILEVGDGAKVDIPKSAKVIDATNSTVMPGLIDSHIHLHGNLPSPYERWHLHGRLGANTLLGLVSPAWVGLVNAANGKEWLNRGFTTLRDLGFSLDAAVGLKKAQEMGLLVSSKIVASGYVFGTGSHLSSVYPPQMILEGKDTGVADGADEIRKRIRTLVYREADVVKTCATSGASTGEFRWRNYTLEEMIALCDEARAWDRIVACHSHASGGISTFVETVASTNALASVEHGTMLRDCNSETIRLMKERSIFLVPTVGGSQKPGYDESIKKMTARHKENVLLLALAREESFRLAHREGIKIAFGTDSYPEPIPERAYPGTGEGIPIYKFELETYVKWGMKPIDTIRAATLTSAEACGVAKQTGSLTAGKRADILVVKGNPLDNISTLADKRNLEMVMQDGKIINRSENI